MGLPLKISAAILLLRIAVWYALAVCVVRGRGIVLPYYWVIKRVLGHFRLRVHGIVFNEEAPIESPVVLTSFLGVVVEAEGRVAAVLDSVVLPVSLLATVKLNTPLFLLAAVAYRAVTAAFIWVFSTNERLKHITRVTVL